MNKSKYILLAALLLASCTQDELPQDTPGSGFSGVITFNSPYTATRSDALRSGDFVAGDQVGVLGFCKASNKIEGVDDPIDYSTSPWDTKKMFAKPDVFYNQMLEYQGDGSWTYKWSGTFDNQGQVGGDSEGGLHPWSTNPDDTFSFFAYYPYASGDPNDQDERKITIDGVEMGTIKLSGADDTGDPTITYSMPFTTAGDEESMRDWWKVPDFMLAYKVDHKHADGSVRLNFRHIFSALEFEVNNYNPYPITLEDFYFGGGSEENNTGFYKSVTVTGQENDYETGNDIYWGTFKLVGEDKDYTLEYLSCPAAETDDEGNVTNPYTTSIAYNEKPMTLLFIPNKEHKLTTGIEDLYVRLRITSEIEGGINTGDKRTIKLGNQSFQPGVRSIFSINVIGNDIYLQMRSDGTWDDGGDSNITFE